MKYDDFCPSCGRIHHEDTPFCIMCGMRISTIISEYLHTDKVTMELLIAYLSQIQTKADSRIRSSLGKRLGIEIPGDQEEKSTQYWESVRDIAKDLTDKMKKHPQDRFQEKFSELMSLLSSRKDGE